MPKTLTRNQYNDATGAALNTFLDSLFDPWPGPFAWSPGPLFRADLANQIKAAETKGNAVPSTRWLVDNATVTLLVDVLQGYWNGQPVIDDPAPRIIPKDRAFIRFIRDYINGNNLQMRVPRFTCSEKRNNAPSTYRLAGNTVHSFRNANGTDWEPAVVRQFLELLLAGAHFVVVHSPADLGDDVNLPDFFTEFSELQGAAQTGHSHYTALVALNGKNYPPLVLNEEADDTLDSITNNAHAVLLPVVLSHTTSNKNNNSFFQMEGWRPGNSMYLKGLGYEYTNKVLIAGYRHGADFQTHQKTLWNISTYGASLFSEKRGAPIFLAPQAWMNKQTHLYNGFDGKNGWFKATLVEGLGEQANAAANEEPNKEDV